METLAARLARGEDSAFAELYDACADRLHAYLAVRLGSHDAASDIVQAAFLRAVNSRKRFRVVENPVAYMFQIARNEARRMTQREQAPAGRTVSSDQWLVVESAPNTTIDDSEAIAFALARLDNDDREIVELKLYAGLTFREIAEVTQRAQGTVATRYRRALESLRWWLEKQFK